MLKVGRILGKIAKIKFPSSGFFNKNLEIEKSITSEGFVDFCFKCLENNKVKATLPQEQREQIKNIFRVYKNLLPDEDGAICLITTEPKVPEEMSVKLGANQLYL